MKNELLSILAKMGCTITEENGKIIIEPKVVKEVVLTNGDAIVNGDCIGIFKCFSHTGGVEMYVSYHPYTDIQAIDDLRHATEKEKDTFFNSLKSAGKQWNVEKKCVEDLSYQPKDKELVWAWGGCDMTFRHLCFYDAKNNCRYTGCGKRDWFGYDYYAPFKGEMPEWAKEAFDKLED